MFERVHTDADTSFARLHVARFHECSIMIGAVDDLARLTPTIMGEKPFALLLHLLNGAPVGTPSSATPVRSLVITGRAQRVELSRRAPAVVLTAPRDRITSDESASIVHLRDTPLVRASRSMMLSLADRAARDSIPDARAVDDVLVALLRGVVRDQLESNESAAGGSSVAERLARLIDARHTDPRLDVAQIAREFHMSRRQLYRHVPENTGVATMLAERRLTSARSLLETHPHLTIGEVARRSGFATASRLRAQFVQRLGFTPTEFRRALENRAERAVVRSAEGQVAHQPA